MRFSTESKDRSRFVEHDPPGGFRGRLRRIAAVAAVLGAGLGLTFGAALPANAWGTFWDDVWGDADYLNTLYMYGTPRYHPVGTAYVAHTSTSHACGGGTTFGLRNSSDHQMTNSISAVANSVQHQFTTPSGGSTSIPSGNLYINARGFGGGCGTYYYTWWADFWI